MKMPMAVMFLLAVAQSASTQGQESDQEAITGSWAGTMTIEGQEVHLLLDIGSDGSELSATLEGQSQGWPSLAMDVVSYDTGQLLVRNEAQDMTFEALLTAPDRLTATFQQRQRVLELLLFRVPVLASLPEAATNVGEIVGIWEGMLRVQGTNLPLVFRIRADGDMLLATMDSPSQGIAELAMNEARFDGSRLMLTLNEAGIRYNGVVVGPGRMLGLFTQSGLRLGLTMTQVEAANPFESNVPDLPQTPTPPFPYAVEEVTFESESEGAVLTGSLTLPQDVVAVAAIVSGSGQQTRDGGVAGHRTYLALADYLSRNGIAVLRYDDRGIGGSRGPLLAATSRNYANDAAAALDYLASRVDLAGKPVGVVGHSEGGLISAMLGAERDDLAFLVLMAGPGVNGIEILDAQNRAILSSAGLPGNLLAARLETLRRLNTIMAGSGDVAGPAAEAEEYLASVFEAYSSSDLQAMGFGTNRDILLRGLRTPWMRYFLAHDPANDLRQISIPVLALYGTRDTQVVADQNAPAVRAALEAAGNENFRVRVFDGLNHLFQSAVTGLPTEYASIEETIAPAVLEEIRDWVHRVAAADAQ